MSVIFMSGLLCLCGLCLVLLFGGVLFWFSSDLVLLQFSFLLDVLLKAGGVGAEGAYADIPGPTSSVLKSILLSPVTRSPNHYVCLYGCCGLDVVEVM